jgi:hypothetical protein
MEKGNTMAANGKLYIAVAEDINRQLRDSRAVAPGQRVAMQEAITRTVKELAVNFKVHNRYFRTERFFELCGLDAHGNIIS